MSIIIGMLIGLRDSSHVKFWGSLQVFRKIWRCQFKLEDEDEDFLQPALMNEDMRTQFSSMLKKEDVKNLIFLRVEEWR